MNANKPNQETSRKSEPSRAAFHTTQHINDLIEWIQLVSRGVMKLEDIQELIKSKITFNEHTGMATVSPYCELSQLQEDHRTLNTVAAIFRAVITLRRVVTNMSYMPDVAPGESPGETPVGILGSELPQAVKKALTEGDAKPLQDALEEAVHRSIQEAQQHQKKTP